VGAVAILFAVLVMRVRSSSSIGSVPDATFRWLLCFLLVAVVGELLRSDLRLANVTTFVSIGAYYLVGTAIGRDLGQYSGRIPMLPALLGIYTVWYLVLVVFFFRGDLGFYGELPDSDLSRLEFRQGFTATELPIYVGFQFPVLIFTILGAHPIWLRVWGGALSICAVGLVILTMSSAALFALVLVLLVFLIARGGIDWRAVIRSLALLTGAIVLAIATSGGLVNSVQGKLQEFAVGEGVRALIYAELITDVIEQPLGIGKGRFVETNSFSWLGEGVYPHQNLLGIAAELGVLALLLYIGFLIAATVSLSRVAFGRRCRAISELRMLAAMVLAVLVYQQFRGLFQDTWVIRETYMWLGVASGAIVSSRARCSGVDDVPESR
jgi:hypothetical protein